MKLEVKWKSVADYTGHLNLGGMVPIQLEGQEHLDALEKVSKGLKLQLANSPALWV